MPVARKIQCCVTQLTDHGEGVYTVELTTPSGVPRFKPGQFLHLALDRFEPGGFWPESRVFSIASSPLLRDRMTVTYAVKGAFTARMERELSPGRDVWVKLPYGEFVVDPAKDAVLFAGGTGVTAFTAFLQSLQPGPSPGVLLLYGARTPELLVYGPLVEACSRDVASLSCHLLAESNYGVLDAVAAWPLIEGLDAPEFYLSGPAAMLTALTAQLLDLGVAPDGVHTDAWE